MTDIEVEGYEVTDEFFGRPYIDADEWLDSPTRHRHVHGGFEGPSTRFAMRFPPEGLWQGRLYQPLEGANAGHEQVFAGALGQDLGGVEMTFRLGGYMIESNMGHKGDVMDPKAGPDPTIYGWRAAAESARFSKYVAEQVLGARPSYSYVWGGSGGARRSPLCLAYGPDVWDGAMPFMGDAMDGDHGDFNLLRTVAQHFCAMFNVQRLLGPKIFDVVDAMLPGGSGDPFEGLDSHQRAELATLYRLGYPRGDEFMIAQPQGQMWLWASYAARLQKEYPDYWDAFWTEPGHVGHDEPQYVEDDLIDVHTTVVRTLTPNDILSDPVFREPENAGLRKLAGLLGGMHGMLDTAMAVECADLPGGYRLGTGITIESGQAAGRQLFAMAAAGDVFLCDGEGEDSNLRFRGVEPGDAVHVSNRAFLAYCYMYRHHLADSIEYDSLRQAGRPIYPQYEIPESSPFMGTVHTGRFEGKMLWIHHTHDASLWPSQGIGMRNNVARELGARAGDHFCLRWTQNAEHVTPQMAASPPGRDNKTWLIDYAPVLEQCHVDLQRWVEEGVRPTETTFEYDDGQINLPSSAALRGGIQPVVHVTADGGSRAEINAGEEVTLTVHAEVPDDAGTIIGVKWDFDGSGTYPLQHPTGDVDGTQSELELSVTHTFDEPGTWFATAFVESHREGDLDATSRRIPNVASARVVVR